MLRWKTNAHRIGKLAYSAMFIAVASAIILIPTELRLAYRVVAAALVTAIAVAVYVSPRVRIYFQMQFLGAESQSAEREVSKYTLLERDLPKLRKQCCELVRKTYDSALDCHDTPHAWQAVEVDGVPFALFPGIVELNSGVRVEVHLVAAFLNGQWTPTPMAFPGTIEEAGEQLSRLALAQRSSK